MIFAITLFVMFEYGIRFHDLQYTIPLSYGVSYIYSADDVIAAHFSTAEIEKSIIHYKTS